MKFLVIFFPIYLFIVGCSSFDIKKEGKTRTSISKNLVVDLIAPNTYVVKDISFYNSNVLVTKMTDGTVIIISSPIETVRTKNMLNWIQDELRPKKIIAINTHFHADGTGGNEGYHGVGAEIWSSKQTDSIYRKNADSLRLELANFVKDEELSRLVMKRKSMFATKLFNLESVVEWVFDKETVKVFYPGPSHTEDHIVVYFPNRKVLFGGCILRDLDWKNLGNLKDANLNKYHDSVKSLLQFESEFVIPGHGEIGDMSLVHHTIGLAKKTQKSKN